MMHPDTALAYISSEVGFGVTASALIPTGTLIWVQDSKDQVFSDAEFQVLDPLFRSSMDHYSYRNHKGEHILCWDDGRFINHSCDATTAALGNVASIACRDIQIGEQLTEDYASFNLSYDFDCFCGAPACRKRVARDDLVKISAALDERSTRAMRTFEKVPQPLIHLMKPDEEKMLLDVARGLRPPLSCLDNRYSGS